MSRASRELAAELFINPDTVEDATLVRQGAGDRNEFGEFVPGATTEHPVIVVTAPIDGQDRQTLPEGMRDRTVRTFWLRERIEAVDESTEGHTGDVLRYGGNTWEAFHVDEWGGFFEAMTVKTS